MIVSLHYCSVTESSRELKRFSGMGDCDTADPSCVPVLWMSRGEVGRGVCYSGVSYSTGPWNRLPGGNQLWVDYS